MRCDLCLQALVAESIGREESMDLFRHSTELGLHEQAAVGKIISLVY